MTIPIWVLVISKYDKESHDCIEVNNLNNQNITEQDSPNEENGFWMLVTYFLVILLFATMATRSSPAKLRLSGAFFACTSTWKIFLNIINLFKANHFLLFRFSQQFIATNFFSKNSIILIKKRNRCQFVRCSK